jgi:hypothetical protein
VGTSLRPRTSSKPWYGVDTKPGHAALALILDLRMDRRWGAKKSTFSAACVLCAWTVYVKYLAFFPIQSKSPKEMFLASVGTE